MEIIKQWIVGIHLNSIIYYADNGKYYTNTGRGTVTEIDAENALSIINKAKDE